MKGTIFFAGGMLLWAGCSNPLEGDWRGDNPYGCGRDEFTADGDMSGDGTVYLVNGSGYCIDCRFDFDAKERSGGRYAFDIQFAECNCDGNRRASAECDMNDSGDRLECMLEWGLCSPNDSERFDKR